MIESHLVGGNQPIAAPDELVYGKSITDACLGWADSEMLLERLRTVEELSHVNSDNSDPRRPPAP